MSDQCWTQQLKSFSVKVSCVNRSSSQVHQQSRFTCSSNHESVDRVIVATRYATGVERLIEPSVAEELITTLEVPVCIIGRRTHPGPACSTPLGRVLLATSLHSSSAMLARFANTLAEVNHSQLARSHVLDNERMSEQQREMTRLLTQRNLSALVPIEARHRHKPIFLIREGDPATIILDEAGSLPQDIVVLGTSKPSMVSRILTNSVAHRVVLESQCPGTHGQICLPTFC